MAKKMTNDGVWATADEIRFIQRVQPKGMSKLQFLKNYKEGLCQRRNWDSIQKVKLLKALNMEIKHEQGEA